jgi:predicted ribosomally synthesized peptide with nif11-like leader
LNSQEAADLLGIRHFILLNYARRRVIPGKIIGNEWHFEESELLAWLKYMGGSGVDLEVALRGARGFVQRLRLDSKFRQEVESFSDEAELFAFARREGFLFTNKELSEALTVQPDARLSESRGGMIPRKHPRFQTDLEVFKVNGQPVTGTFILDFSNSGVKISAPTPFEKSATIYLTFTLPGESNMINIGGRVVWSKLVPEELQYHAGIEFFIPIDQLHREGKI